MMRLFVTLMFISCVCCSLIPPQNADNSVGDLDNHSDAIFKSGRRKLCAGQYIYEFKRICHGRQGSKKATTKAESGSMDNSFNVSASGNSKENILDTVKCFLSAIPPYTEITVSVQFAPSTRLPQKTLDSARRILIQEETLDSEQETSKQKSIGSVQRSTSNSRSRRHKKKRAHKEKRRREKRMLQRQESNSSMNQRISETENEEVSEMALTEVLFPPAKLITKDEVERYKTALEEKRKTEYPRKSKTEKVPLAELKNPKESMFPKKKTSKTDESSNYETLE